MDNLEKLEAKSVYILREAYRDFKNLCMLWSIGKDSTVLLWLARKAFFGHVPLPLVHIDTHFKIPEMIEYRDRLALEWNLNMVYGENREALEAKQTFPDGNVDRLNCCRNLKSDALKHTLAGDWPRYRMDHALRRYVLDENKEPYTGVIVARASVWNPRLNPATAADTSESMPSVSTSTAWIVNTYRCGGSPTGGAAPPKSFEP